MRCRGKFVFRGSLLVSALLISSLQASQAESGIASVYSGGRTANGEHARASGFTAAHKTLPFGTMVQVINRRTGRSVIVRINDRGPFVKGRVIDLTPAAANALGFSGLAPVSLNVMHGDTPAGIQRQASRANNG